MPDEDHSAANPLKPNPPAQNDPIESQTADEARKQLKEAITGSNQILASAKTVMSLFPDTVCIDRAKYTVTKRTFFRTAEVMSINVEDIFNVSVTIGVLFGTIKVVSRASGTTEKPFTENLLWRQDAMHLKRVLQGYIIALQRSIDCSALPTKELVTMLEQLGHDDHENKRQT